MLGKLGGRRPRIMDGCVGLARVRHARSVREAYCALVHAGLAFAKLFMLQKLEPQLAFLSIASSVPLPDASIPNTWFPPLPLSIPIPAKVLVSAVVVAGTA